MKLDNFKELLSKKAEGNDNLKLLIKYIRDDYLVNHVVESLEKMARSDSRKNPNASVMHFASNMNNFKSGMIHDQLSHHASHYKAALKAGYKSTAGKHMRQIFKTMHMADKFTKDGLTDHSGGRLNISSVDPKPWERSGYKKLKQDKKTGAIERDSKGRAKFSTDTRGWGRHVDNYEWLQGAPHDAYKNEVSRHGHNKAYPLNEIKVNDKHIHIDDVDHSDGKFNPHPFDSHPIFSHYSESPKTHSADKKAKYLEAREKFHNDENGGKAQYRNKLANMSKEDWSARGSKKSDPVHADIPGLDVGERRPASAPVASAPVTSEPVAAPAPAPSQPKESREHFESALDRVRGERND